MKRKRLKSLLTLAALCCLAAGATTQPVDIEVTGEGTLVVASPDVPQAGDVVTITVAPASGHQITKNDIKVQATIPPEAGQTPRRAPAVGFPIDLLGEEPPTTTVETSYTFVMPDEPYGVLITATFTVADITALGDVAADPVVADVIYVTPVGHVGPTPSQGVNVEVTTYADGSKAVRKVVNR